MAKKQTLRYRLSRTVEIELVFGSSDDESGDPVNRNNVGIVETSGANNNNNLLDVASLTNFTGRIVVHRAEERGDKVDDPEIEVVFTKDDDEASSNSDFNNEEGPAHSESKRGRGKARNMDDRNKDGSTSSDSASELVAVKKKKTPLKKKQVSFDSDDDEENGSSGDLIPRRRLSRETGSLIVRAIGQILTRRNIPEHIRQKRDRSTETKAAPLPLHELCAHSDVSLDELYDCLGRNPQAMKQQDEFGRYPLHILSDNVTLITSVAGRKTATAFCNHLIQEYPEAILAPDRDGLLPFFYLISDWVNDVTDEKKFLGDEGSLEYSNEVFSGMHYPGTSGLLLSSRRRRRSSADNNNSSGNFFRRAEMYEEVEWCFGMLSIEIDVLGRIYSSPMLRRSLLKKHRQDTRHQLVEQLALQMPMLVRTVLLVDDDGIDSRSKVLNSSLFRRLLICPLIIDRWLVRMLKHGGVPSTRGVDFLIAISDSTIDDFTGGFGAPMPKDWEAFNEAKKEVFSAVANLTGTIASLVTMKKEEIERAASTSVIWHAMSTKLSRPFVLGLVLIDLVLHLTLMVAFRNEAGVQPVISTHDDGAIAENVIYVICTHYLLRKVCELWALLSLSRTAFLSYLTNMWTVFEIFAVILTIFTTALDRNGSKVHNGLNAFVVGLLWIKVLAFLKVVNREMATFVLSLTQILSDIRFFMVVLVVCVFMFGDMFHIAVNGKDNGYYCDDPEKENGAIEDFCSSSWEATLRVYAILIGDFEYSDMTATTGTAILFVIFTVFGVIILLNVLIAVISDSYEKATLSSNVLFGRARVMFVAQNDSLESFLKPPSGRLLRPLHRRGEEQQLNRSDSEEETMRSRLFSTTKWTGRWAVLCVILGTTVYAEVFLLETAVSTSDSGDEDAAIFVITTFLVVLLSAGLWVVLASMLKEILQDRAQRLQRCHHSIEKYNEMFVRCIAGWLFGLKKDKGQTAQNEEDEEWGGRMKFMEQAIERVVAEAKRELKMEIQEAKAEVQDAISNASPS